MILLWLLAGIVTVSLAFFLPENAVDPWGPLNTAGIAAAVYVLALASYAFRPPFSRRSRIAGWSLTLIVGVALIVSWRGFDEQSHYQAGVMPKIRGVIARGVIANELSEPMLHTLEAYYAQHSGKKKSLRALFRDFHEGVEVGWDVHQKFADNDRLSVIVTILNDNEVMLVAEEGSVKGDDPAFENRSGNKGMMQESAHLTEGGITYERQN